MRKKNMDETYVVILNFEKDSIDVLNLCGMRPNEDAKDYIEEKLNYSLTNCEWMVTGSLKVNFKSVKM